MFAGHFITLQTEILLKNNNHTADYGPCRLVKLDNRLIKYILQRAGMTAINLGGRLRCECDPY